MINKPNTDQAGGGSLAGALGEFLRSRLLDIDDMLPAIVISYDDKSNRAILRPLVKMVDTSGNQIPRASISNIPVFRFGGGGFFMRFPIKPGDFGWIKANDRDISLILQGGGNQDIPNTRRIKSFSDAMFFPDTIKDWLIDGDNQDAVVLQSLSGESVISVHQDAIKFKTKKIDMDCDEFLLKSKSSTLESLSTQISSPGLTIDSTPLQVGAEGSKVTTPATFSSDVTTEAGITNKGKDIGSGHSHSGVQEGGGNTGEVT